MLTVYQLDPKEHISMKFNWNAKIFIQENVDGFVQDCSNFIANALELLQS